jgi:uncharacterized protein YhaN
LWEHRNGFVHKPGTERTGNELRKQVKEEYLRGRAGVLQPEKALFNESVHELMQKSEQYMMDWLGRVQASRSSAEEAETIEERQIEAQRALLRNFFTANGRSRQATEEGEN